MATLKKTSSPLISPIDGVLASRRMTSKKIEANLDALTDVLSVWIRGTNGRYVSPAPRDTQLLIERDEEQKVVGIQIFGASSLVTSFWLNHPDRGLVPHILLQFVDNWMTDAWAEPTKLP